jgi:hypothetical protein
MDLYMELVKKATILFPPDLYDDLARLAKRSNTSVGDLVRSACRKQYGLSHARERIAAVRQLAALSLPTGSPEQMERESLPAPEPLP